MRSSLSDPGATQVAVIYDLDYRGLLPAYQAKITIEFKQAYQYLHTRMALNTLWLKADVDAEMERSSVKKDTSRSIAPTTGERSGQTGANVLLSSRRSRRNLPHGPFSSQACAGKSSRRGSGNPAAVGAAGRRLAARIR